MSHQDVFDRQTGLLFLNLSSVSLVLDDCVLKDLLEMLSFLLLRLEVIKLVATLDALHCLKFVPERKCSIEDLECLLDHSSLLIPSLSCFLHAFVKHLLDLRHHQHFVIADGILVLAHAQ